MTVYVDHMNDPVHCPKCGERAVKSSWSRNRLDWALAHCEAHGLIDWFSDHDRLFHLRHAVQYERDVESLRRSHFPYDVHLTPDDWSVRRRNAEELDRLAQWHRAQAQRLGILIGP